MAKGYIYKFTENYTEKKRVEVTRKNEETGQEEVILETQEVAVPVELAVKRPTRRLSDEAELQYSIELSKNIKNGVVTKAMLIKKYADTGGALTEEETKEMVKKLQRSNEIANKIQYLGTLGDESKEEAEELESELLEIRKDLIDIETAMQGVYQHTADARAERAVLTWYTIQLARVIENGEEKPFFDGLLYEDKLEDFYKKQESEDEYESNATERFLKAVSVWFYNQIDDQETIDKALNAFEEDV